MVITRSGERATGVVATNESFPALGSPGVLTCATFVTLGDAAGPTFTVSSTTAESPTATGPADVHVTAEPTALQAKPAPVPDTNVSPAGRLSVIVTVPDVAAVPTFVTDSRYCAAYPTVNVPTAVLRIDRSGAVPIGAGVADDALFVAFGSPVTSTCAVFDSEPIALGLTFTFSVSSAESPGASAAVRVHVTTWPLVPQAKPPPAPNTYDTTAASVSVTVIADEVAAEPTFLTLIENAAPKPAVTLPGPVLVIARSGAVPAGVTAVPLLFAGFASPAVLALAVFVTLGTAPAATDTVSRITDESAAAIGPALVHVTVAPDAEQLHPAPVPLTKSKPAGSGSVTVIAPVVELDPMFFTDNRYVPFTPTVNGALAVFTSVRSGALVTGVPTSVKLLSPALVSLAVLTVTVLFTLAAADASTSTVSVSAELAPAAIGPALAHVTVWPSTIVPVAEQLHPVPLALV